MRQRYDVVVVGARCAGAATALLLARRGHSVLLVDRGRVGADALSTHYIHESGIRRLAEWGVLDELRATGCPALTTFRLSIGGVMIEDNTEPDRLVAPYGPRRFILDALLVRAAVAAGAELREQTSVRELLRTDGTVSGVELATHGAPTQGVEATLVIGADGSRSTVAKLVGARVYRETAALTCGFYSYWEGVDCPAGLFIQDHTAAVAVPTNGGAVCLGAGWPIGELPRVRQNLEREYLAVISALIPEFTASPGRRRLERLYGLGNPTSCFRDAAGPGWALVGDAGHRTDPIAASGITEAFHQAELLAEAAHRGLVDPGEMADALRSFWIERDARAVPLHRATEVLGQLHYSPEIVASIEHAFSAEPTDSLSVVLGILSRAAKPSTHPTEAL